MLLKLPRNLYSGSQLGSSEHTWISLRRYSSRRFRRWRAIISYLAKTWRGGKRMPETYTQIISYYKITSFLTKYFAIRFRKDLYLATVLLTHLNVQLAESSVSSQKGPAVVHGDDTHLVFIVTRGAGASYYVRGHTDDHVDDAVAIVVVRYE